MKGSLFLSLLVAQASLYAQRPDWTYAEKRLLKYPESRYLTGFFSEREAPIPASEKWEILKGYARAELLQSILASIVSVGELKISNVNDDGRINTRENYEQSSVILAEADIVGLQYETFYDKANRDVYAFAYAGISKVTNYYKDVIDKNEKEISQKISDAKYFESRSDNEGALKEYFQCYPLFSQIREAQGLLIALGVRDDISLRKTRTNDLESDMKEGISRLTNSDNLTLEEVAQFFAYGLKIQVENPGGNVLFDVISFEDTKLESDFSRKFHKIYESRLVDAAGYDISNIKNVSKEDWDDFPVQLSTSYWQQNDKIKIITHLKKGNKTIAGVESSLSVSYLNSNGLNFNPGHLKKLELLKDIRLEAVNKKISGQYKSPLEEPLEVKIITGKDNMMEDGVDSLSVAGTPDSLTGAKIPIKFTYSHNEQSFGPVYPVGGLVKATIDMVESKQALQIITATVDLENFLDINSATFFYQKILNSYNVPSATFFLSVTGIPVYITEDKKDFYVVPRIKQILSDNGFDFVSDYENADLYIEVDGKVRESGQQYGLSISYVDAKVNITDLKTGRNVYANAFNSVKGIDSNYEKAAVKALNGICKKLQDDIVSYLSSR